MRTSPANLRLSIIVIFFNMRREAERTLYTLSANYQQDVNASEYEVIAIENGSPKPLSENRVKKYGSNFRYHFHETSSPSPVEAVNLGVGMANSDRIAVIVDGARMASPRLINRTLSALELSENSFVASLAWHLGPDIQPRSIQLGYDQKAEDDMLASVDWQNNGYLLFDLSTLAPSSRGGFLGHFPPECSWFAMKKEEFSVMGGLDTRFQSPGGGLCNHDFRDRVLSRPRSFPILLLGEGVFHQVHGGCATNFLPGNRPKSLFAEEYRTIKGRKYENQNPEEIIYFGSMNVHAMKHLVR